jgi:hypothetical protein
LHWREKLESGSPFDPTIEIGRFGDYIGLYCTNADVISAGVESNNDVALVSDVKVTFASEAIVNRAILLGSGEGTAALDLSSIADDYPGVIFSRVNGDGQTEYYIQNDASIEYYGDVFEDVWAFKDAVVIVNTDAGVEAAALTLLNWGLEEIERRAWKQEAYSVSLKKCTHLVQPGDVIRLVFRGQIRDQNGKPIDSEEIDGYYTVLKAKEQVSGEGSLTTSLEVSNIDRRVMDAFDRLVESQEKTELRNKKAVTFPTLFPDKDMQEIEAPNAFNVNGLPAGFFYRVSTLISDVSKVTMTVRTYPLATRLRYNNPVAGQLTTPIPLYSPDEGMRFSVRRDDQYPSGLSVFINGIDRTAELGGPWNSGVNVQTNLVDLDISEYIINASGGLRQTHEIVFTCESRTGDVAFPGAGTASGEASHGYVVCSINAIASVQAIIVEG